MASKFINENNHILLYNVSTKITEIIEKDLKKKEVLQGSVRRWLWMIERKYIFCNFNCWLLQFEVWVLGFPVWGHANFKAHHNRKLYQSSSIVPTHSIFTFYHNQSNQLQILSFLFLPFQLSKKTTFLFTCLLINLPSLQIFFYQAMHLFVLPYIETILN